PPLAVGIGANTAIFSVLHAALLRPLPYTDPARLVAIGTRSPGGLPGNTGYSTFIDWRDETHAFERMALIRLWQPTMLVSGEPERINGMRVSAEFFRMLGVTPALGRDFTAADDTPAGWRVVLLSDGLRRRRLGGGPSVVGRAIGVTGQPLRLGGVVAPAVAPALS